MKVGVMLPCLTIAFVHYHPIMAIVKFLAKLASELIYFLMF